MNLAGFLAEKRNAVLNKWFDLIVETYPPETAKFLKSQKNRFANPVGATVLEGMEGILDSIIKQKPDAGKVSSFLDNIIRIRAVQDFTPSQSLEFIFILKKIIRSEMQQEISENLISDELLSLEDTIDELALLAFDIYVRCREKIYEIRANEVRNMTYRLLQKANLVSEAADKEPSDTANNFINIRNINERR